MFIIEKLISGAGSYDKSIKIWNLKEKNCEFTLLGHKREVRCLNELKNGFLINGSMDKSIRIWNVNKKIFIQVLNLILMLFFVFVLLIFNFK